MFHKKEFSEIGNLNINKQVPELNQHLSHDKNSIIISDLHVGSRYFFHEKFLDFIEKIPEDCDLILNGDIIDNPYAELEEPHRKVVDMIGRFSKNQTVIWISGNHDKGYIPKGMDRVRFKKHHNIGQRLLIFHGHDFDKIMPRSLLFMKAFLMMHNLRVRLGAKPVHVAQYANRWTFFYNVLRRNVMLNAANCAMENGYEAVTCGHTHYAEDTVTKGVRYINTGAWTELPVFYFLVEVDSITL